MDSMALTAIGQTVFMLVVFFCCSFAMVETILGGMKGGAQAALLRSSFNRSALWGGGLAILQGAALATTYFVPELKGMASMLTIYLLMACFLPALWSSGKMYGAECGIPIVVSHWTKRIKWRILFGVALAGFVLSLALVIAVPVTPGEAVREMGKQAETPLAMGLMAIWLMINAPWTEELIFRHYLVASIAATFKGWRRTGIVVGVVIAAALFAVGHAGHMDPAWPKLVQTFAWGLALGWVRVYFGTGYAIGLHLVWNLSSVFIAPFLQQP